MRINNERKGKVNDGKSKQMFHRLQNERGNTNTQPQQLYAVDAADQESEGSEECRG